MALARRPNLFRSIVPAFVVCVVTLAVAGCGTSGRLDELSTQLAAVEQQLLALQEQVSDKSALAELRDLVVAQGADLTETLQEVATSAERVTSDVGRSNRRLDDTQSSLADLALSIAGARLELEAIREQVAGLSKGEAPRSPPLSSDPESLYRTSFADFEAGNYDLALLGFRHYVDSFANSEQADDALYWIGECYLSQRKYRQAVREFNRVAEQYPRSNRLASALLRKGLAYLALGDNTQGKQALQSVVATFPASDEAILAQEQLVNLVGG